MKKTLLVLLTVLLNIFVFTGCARYYATAPTADISRLNVNNTIPVKVDLKQDGSSIVYSLPDETLKEQVKSILFRHKVFSENENSDDIMNISIKHHNEDGGLELLNAVLVGLSLYVIPGVADSYVDITISLNNVSNTTVGELVVSQGSIASEMVDKEIYIEEDGQNLMKNLIQNALDEFSIKYSRAILFTRRDKI
jgi:hypothetical protein